MFILHFNIYVQVVVDNIKSSLIAVSRDFPSVTNEGKKVLVEVPNTVVVRFVNLSDTFCLNSFFYCLAVYFRIKGKFNRINNIFVEFIKVYGSPILQSRSLDMIENIIIRDKAEIISSHCSLLFHVFKLQEELSVPNIPAYYASMLA